MKTLKKLYSIKILVLFAFILLNISNLKANPTDKNDKKNVSLYKKNYITIPLFVVAMHNGEQYAFINSNIYNYNKNDSKKELSAEKPLTKNKKTKNSCIKAIVDKILEDEVKEIDLKFEDWMMNRYYFSLTIEKDMEIETWMLEENHWNLKK